MRTLLIAVLALTALPLAAAQEEKPDANESQDAWVKDCPPDAMCAYGDETPAGTGDREPIPYGDAGCIECTGGPVDDGANCMDGQQANETCRGDASCAASSSSAEACGDDVYYFGGARGPEGCENCRGQEVEVDPATTQSEAANKVPLPQVALVVAGLAAAVLIVRRAT